MKTKRIREASAMIRSLCVVMLVAACVGFAYADNDAGTTSGALLRLGVGARIPAMGDAGTANSLGVSAMHYNPAALGLTHRGEVEAMYQNLVLDISQGQLGLVHPINSQSSWGIALNYLDYGKSRRVVLTDIINDNVSSTTFSGQDILFSGSYGRMITQSLSAGITAKILNSEIDNTSATAFAVDLGLQLQPSDWPVRFGVVGQNLGTKMTFDKTGEQLPALVRGGIAVDLFNNRLTVSAEAEKVRDQNVCALVGGELRLMEILALRVGYDGRIDADNGLTAGLGVKISDISVDYAYVPYGNFGNSHRLALTYKFGPKY